MYKIYKYFFDFIFSFIGLFFLFPFFLIISILIVFDSFGNPFFFHKRVGKNLKSFHLIKFRTMYSNPDTKKFWTEKNDERVTKIGKILRKYSLDELPQLFNVIKYDMSLVGPRPDTFYQENIYTKNQWIERHSILPGISGLSQTSGRSDLTVSQRIKYDLFYVRKLSFKLDIKILLKTFMQVIKGNSF